MSGVRVRQVVTAVHDLDRAAAAATDAGLPFVHEDPDVAHFGARNSLHAAGDTFLELLAERDEGSAVGRHLRRLGGDGGYMVIVQVDDLDDRLAKAEELGVRTVWQGGVAGIRAAHLHPADVGSAILSVDEVHPPEAWPWCGPDWTDGARPVSGEPIGSITLTAADPHATSRRWGALLDAEVVETRVRLPRTSIRFVPSDDKPDRLVAVGIPGVRTCTVGGIDLHG